MTNQTFDDYWRNYLTGHARPATRVIHYFGLIFGPLIGILMSFSLFRMLWLDVTGQIAKRLSESREM